MGGPTTLESKSMKIRPEFQYHILELTTAEVKILHEVLGEMGSKQIEFAYSDRPFPSKFDVVERQEVIYQLYVTLDEAIEVV